MFRLFSPVQQPLTLAVVLGFCVTVPAQSPRERPRYVLQALDVNHDGQLSAQEIQAAPRSLLTLDRNGDGELTPDELEPPRPDAGANPDQLTAQLMALDRNGDGVLTPDELPERLQAMFLRADTNHDGKVTPDELRQMAAHTGAPTGRLGGPGSASGMMRLDPVLFALDVNHDGTLSAAEIRGSVAALLTLDVDQSGTVEAAEMRVRQQTPQERVAHFLDEWDTDKDGKVSREEAPDRMRARFADADKNSDGYLDGDELLQMFSTPPVGPAGKPGDAAAPPKGQHS